MPKCFHGNSLRKRSFRKQNSIWQLKKNPQYCRFSIIIWIEHPKTYEEWRFSFYISRYIHIVIPMVAFNIWIQIKWSCRSKIEWVLSNQVRSIQALILRIFSIAKIEYHYEGNHLPIKKFITNKNWIKSCKNKYCDWTSQLSLSHFRNVIDMNTRKRLMLFKLFFRL